MARTIMIVDDDKASVKLFDAVLRSHGLDSVVSVDGEDVIQLAREHHPDLILMDIMLPYLSGIELTRILKADSDLCNIPVLAVTGLAMKNDRESILAAGCDGYISKPIFILSFIAEIKKYLRLGQFRIIDTMRTGNAQIDAEHEQILILLNEFSGYEEAGDYHRCTAKLRELLEVMKNHLKNEEIIMESIEYNKLESQRKGHAYMIGELEELISSWESKVHHSNFTDVLTSILIEDFIGGDKDFGEYYRATQARYTRTL